MTIRLAQLESFLGVDFYNKALLMGIPLKYKGLFVPQPKRTYGGAKVQQLFLLQEGNENSKAVSINYEDVLKDGSIVKIKKTVQYYNEDDSIYCSKVEYELVRNEDKLKRSRSQAAYDYLRNSSKGTPVEPFVNAILEHYASQISLWLLGSKNALLDAIDKETDAKMIGYLNLVVNLASGKKVKDTIFEQVNGMALNSN